MVKKQIKIFFIFILLLNTENVFSQNFTIPSHTITITDYLPEGFADADVKINVNSFSVSKQVTLKQYKEFLSEMKKNSSEEYYLSLLPDSSFTTKELYEKYFNSTLYDEFPVVGVSWENALNYCKWLTLKENKNELKYIYRLPNLYEWLWAKEYLSSIAESDFDKLYSDWLMDAKDESHFTDEESRAFSLSYYYFHEKNDPPVLKRKKTIGASFQYQFSSLLSYTFLSFYADHGYRNIGFRIVKDDSNESLNIFSKLEMNGKSVNVYTNPLLQYWKLTPAQ